MNPRIESATVAHQENEINSIIEENEQNSRIEAATRAASENDIAAKNEIFKSSKIITFFVCGIFDEIYCNDDFR